MKFIKRMTAVILVFMLLATQAYGSSIVPDGSAVFPQPTAPLKKAIPGTAKPDVNKILKIAEKYYKMALSKATLEEKNSIKSAVYWKPDFTGKKQNAALALNLSYPSAYLTSYTNLKGLYLALNSAIFAMDMKNPTAAGNLASSIAAYEEDSTGKPLGKAVGLKLKDVQTYVNDAAAVYEYALGLKFKAASVDGSAMPLLLNYGYLSIDRGKLPTAKLMFETAVKLVPKYLPAMEGMAAYWLAAGDKKKAQKALEGAVLPALYKQIKKTGEDCSDKKVPQIEAGESLGSMEQKLKTLSEVPTVVATDFYSDMDPAGTAKVRSFVNAIAKEWKFTSPGFSYLSQFSTLSAFSSGQGQAALKAFGAELGVYSEKYMKAFLKNEQNLINNMGLDISVGGVDLNDVMSNPEKYKDYDFGDNVTIDGLDEIMKNAQKAQSDLAKGNTDSAMNMAATIDPAMAILQMNPGDYANPTDIITQKYNMTVLLRKITGYKNYFYKMNTDISNVIQEDTKKLTAKMKEIVTAMDAEREKIDIEHETTHNYIIDGYDIVPPQDLCDKCKLKIHALHENYDPKMNQLAETIFVDATNYVSSRFVQKFKPNIEAMYSDCMKNCMLISDPKVRKLKEDAINTEVYQAVFTFMSNVASAYGLADHDYPHQCDCSEEEIAALKERERKAHEEEEYYKTIMENKARKEFEQGGIKETSVLYQRLDKYSAEYNLLFMNAKWHPLKTEVSFNVKAPVKGVDLGVSAKMVQDHARNTTTYGGGLSASVSGKVGKVGVGGSLSVQGEITTDGNGNVVRTDATGSASGSASAGSYEATGAFEASTMRGCKLSGEVTKLTGDTLKPPNAVEAWDDYTEAIGVFLPEKPKKVLWNGEYRISK